MHRRSAVLLPSTSPVGSGFVMHNEWVMFLTEYSKTQSRSTAPRVIPRFLLTKAGRLLVDILPFEGYLRYAAGMKRNNAPVREVQTAPSARSQELQIVPNRIANHRYEIRTDTVTWLPSDGVRIFTIASRKWHRFWLGKRIITARAHKSAQHPRQRLPYRWTWTLWCRSR